MQTRDKIRTVAAVVTVLATACFLAVDVQGVAPSVSWQYPAIAGFAVFVLLTAWGAWDRNQIIHALEQQLAERRPEITIGKSLGASTNVDDNAKVVNLVARLRFHNVGNRPAYQFRMRTGYARVERPNEFVVKPNLENPNRLDAGGEVGPDLELSMPFVDKEGGGRAVPTKEILIYVGVRYSDKPTGGSYWEEDFWFVYVLGKPLLAMQHLAQKEALEPYVRAAYAERDG